MMPNKAPSPHRRWTLIRAALLLGTASLLSGCAAALVPIAAAGLYGGKQLAGRDLEERAPAFTRSALSNTVLSGSAELDGVAIKKLDLTELPAPGLAERTGPLSTALPDDARESEDYLRPFLAEAARRQQAGDIGESVVLMPETDPANPQVTLCDGLPYAMLIALDRPLAKDSSGADPDDVALALSDSVAAAHDAGIAVLFTSDLPPAQAPAVERALNAAGLGPTVHGTSLFFTGDRGSTDSDSLRWKIASNHCVIAMTGSTTTDFSLIFGRYPEATLRASNIASLWNAGWFLSPEPLAIPAQTGQSLNPNAGLPASADNGDRP